MRDLTQETITDYIAASFETSNKNRQTQLMTGLVKCLHGFIRDVDLSHGEWAKLLNFFYQVGEKTTGAVWIVMLGRSLRAALEHLRPLFN